MREIIISGKVLGAQISDLRRIVQKSVANMSNFGQSGLLEIVCPSDVTSVKLLISKHISYVHFKVIYEQAEIYGRDTG